MDLKVEKVTVGILGTNCYIVSADNEVAVIDPGDDPDLILDKLKGREESVKYIILTHTHSDHVSALDSLAMKVKKAEIVVSEQEIGYLKKIENPNPLFGLVFPGFKAKKFHVIKDGDKLPLGNNEFEVMVTPGHTPGSTCYLIDNKLFSGDTFFYHAHGMTDFPGGSIDEMIKSLERISRLPESTEVYPGHLRETTIKIEKDFGLL